MKYAEVSVNSPAARRRTFSYALPEGMDVRAGQAVLVPFGEKVLQGIVMELTPLPGRRRYTGNSGYHRPGACSFRSPFKAVPMDKRILSFTAFRCRSINAATGV